MIAVQLMRQYKQTHCRMPDPAVGAWLTFFVLGPCLALAAAGEPVGGEESLVLDASMDKVDVFRSVSYAHGELQNPPFGNISRMDCVLSLRHPDHVRLVGWSALRVSCISETGVTFEEEEAVGVVSRNRIHTEAGKVPRLNVRLCGPKGAFCPPGRHVTISLSGRITVCDPQPLVSVLRSFAPGIHNMDGLSRPIAITRSQFHQSDRIAVHWDRFLDDQVATCSLLSASRHQYREVGSILQSADLKDTMTAYFYADRPFQSFPEDLMLELALNQHVRTLPCSLGPFRVTLPDSAAEQPDAEQGTER